MTLKCGAIVFCFMVSVPSMASIDQGDLFGNWLFYKMIYKGELMDPLNPQLVMTFNFQDNGQNTLSFHRTDEEGFCERTALWFYNREKQELHQHVTWANVKNRADCNADPDFQVGHESFSPFKLENDQLYLTVPLADEKVVLVWKRLPSPQKEL